MIKEIQFRNIAEYINIINKLPDQMKCHSSNIWYRGISSIKYSLVPRVVWMGITDENSLVCDFLVSYRSYFGTKISDGLELYTLMQHYGLPTRLLDWTKSPLMALYFCLEKKNNSNAQRVVWAMNVINLNKITINENMIVVPKFGDNCFTKPYLPYMLGENRETEIPPKPFALEPLLTNQRILAQQGCFTLHGTEKKSIDEYFSIEAKPTIVKLTLKDNSYRPELLNSLYNLGFREDNIYQDLDSLSARIIRERRW